MGDAVAGEPTLAEIGAVTAVPALAMALGSAAISVGEPSERLQARLQHFSAGLLIGAVVTDIFPILRERLVSAGTRRAKVVQWPSLLAAFIGFTLGLLLMYGLKSLSPEESEAAADSSKAEEREGASRHGGMETDAVPQKASDMGEPLLEQTNSGLLDHNSVHQVIARLDARATALSMLVAEEDVDREAVDEEVHGIDFLLDAARRSCRKAEPVDVRNALRLRDHAGELAEDVARMRGLDTNDLTSIDKQLKVIAATLRHVHSHVDRGVFRRWRPQPVRDSIVQQPAPIASVPWGLVVAVVVDSMVDGMLIGLAGSVAIESGWLMAMATAIEMGFLGYSFACSLTKTVQRCKAAVILALPPLTMLTASTMAFAGASDVEGQPSFVGLIAFALVALLFLVVEELLLEAHEKEGSESWRISGCLYIGLLLSVILDAVL